MHLPPALADEAPRVICRHAGKLAEALTLDMGAWFTPTAGNYFSRVSKPQIIEALTESLGHAPAPGCLTMKKTELAAYAERHVKAGWLPKALRAEESAA